MGGGGGEGGEAGGYGVCLTVIHAAYWINRG